MIEDLADLALSPDDEKTIAYFLSIKGYAGLALNELRVMTNVPDKKLAAAFAENACKTGSDPHGQGEANLCPWYYFDEI